MTRNIFDKRVIVAPLSLLGFFLAGIMAMLPAQAQRTVGSGTDHLQIVELPISGQSDDQLRTQILDAVKKYYLSLASDATIAPQLKERLPKFSKAAVLVLEKEQIQLMVLSEDRPELDPNTLPTAEDPWTFKFLVGQPVRSKLLTYPTWIAAFSQIEASFQVSTAASGGGVGQLNMSFAGFSKVEP